MDSTIPAGSGLSTSAALCCATILAATGLYGDEPAPAEVARLAQRAENDFVGMPCGIMDQSAVMLSDEGRAAVPGLPFLATEQEPFDLAAHGVRLLVVDTKAPRRLVEGAYAERRRSCENAARLLGGAGTARRHRRGVAQGPGGTARRGSHATGSGTW